MSKNKIIKATPLSKTNSKICANPVSADNETVRFSFKHLDLNHKKFSLEDKTNEYFLKLLERLKGMSSLKISEVFSNRSPSLRAHPIDSGGTTEKNGFKHLNKQYI